jgi:ubiquinone/menaquinone biosynthesis C-methylase UbiE
MDAEHRSGIVPRPADAPHLLPARDAYDRAASTYDAWGWQAFWRRNEAPLVVGMARSLGGVRRILDVGTGTGYYVPPLKELHAQVVGIDVSQGMLDVAWRRVGRGTALLQGDVRELPFADGEFDLVVCTRVLTHVWNVGAALSEINRVLRPGGFLIASDLDGAHNYPYTRLPTNQGKVAVQTYKRTLAEFTGQARNGGFVDLHSRVLTAHTVRWIPPRGLLRRIDRSGRTPVGYVALLVRGPGASPT